MFHFPPLWKLHRREGEWNSLSIHNFQWKVDNTEELKLLQLNKQVPVSSKKHILDLEKII